MILVLIVFKGLKEYKVSDAAPVDCLRPTQFYWLFQAPVELFLNDSQVLIDGLLYASLRIQSRDLSIHWYVVFLLEFMGCPVLDLPKVSEVFFVAQKQSYEPVVGILFNFMFPAEQVL